MRTLLAALLLSSLAAAPCLACGTAARQHGNPAPAAEAPGRYEPSLGISIDSFLKEAELSESELDKVQELRSKMIALAAAGDEKQARSVEEEAMRILGFRKTWLHCGNGTFAWMRIPQQS